MRVRIGYSSKRAKQRLLRKKYRYSRMLGIMLLFLALLIFAVIVPDLYGMVNVYDASGVLYYYNRGFNHHQGTRHRFSITPSTIGIDGEVYHITRRQWNQYMAKDYLDEFLGKSIGETVQIKYADAIMKKEIISLSIGNGIIIPYDVTYSCYKNEIMKLISMAGGALLTGICFYSYGIGLIRIIRKKPVRKA